MIKKGSKSITSIMKGNKAIQSIYKGALLVYQAIKEYIVSGVFPLTLSKTKGSNLIDYKMEGNSIQDGTPTPDNPIEVVSVGEKTKNLFNLKSLVDNSILIYNGNETYTFTKTNVDRYTKLVNLVIPANTKFTATAEIIEYTGTSLYPLGVQFQMEDNTYEGFTFSDTTKKYTTSFDRPTKAVRLFLQYGDEVGAYTKFKNLQIEEGSKATEYEPYGYKIPVVSRGKNLLNSLGRTKGSLSGGANTTIREFEFDKYYVGLTMNNYYYPHYVNSYSITDDSIIVNPFNTGYGVGYPVKVKPNTTYSVSCVEGGEIGVGFYTGNGELISYKEQPTEFITPEKCEILTVILRPREKDVDTTYKSVQLEEGTTTEFEPYQEPITTNIYLDEPLRKVGNYADYIDFGNKKLVRNVKSIAINDSDVAYYFPTSNAPYRISTDDIADGTDRTKPEGILIQCSHFQKVAIEDSWANYNSLISRDSLDYKAVCIRYTDVSTLEEFKQYVKEQHDNGNPIIINYALANSTEETIDLPSIPTLEGTTILDSTQNPSYVEVEYTNEEPKTSVPLTLADGNTLLDSNGDYFNVKEV